MKKSCILCHKHFESRRNYYDVCDECLMALRKKEGRFCIDKERYSEKIEPASIGSHVPYHGLFITYHIYDK